MKYFLATYFLLFTLYSTSQEIKVYHEKSKNGYRLFANNNEFSPVSVNIEFNFENLKLEGDHIVVLKPNQQKQYIGDLQIVDKRKRYGFSYKTVYNFGDTFLEEYDEDYEYALPFPKDSTYAVIQGYYGKFSHLKEMAIDFKLPEDTPLFAAREGIVVQVVDTHNTGCPKSECQKFNNLIRILHSDGTFAEYLHLKQEGANVKKGDKVIKRQLIGFSGNTGWSSEPHLHFVVYLQKIYERTTIPTLFRINNDQAPLILEQGNVYLNKL